MNRGPSPAPRGSPVTFRRWIVGAMIAWTILVCSLVTLAVWHQPPSRAVLGMAWTLFIVWVLLGGGAMLKWGDAISGMVQRIPLPWGIRFVVGCTLLALAEEAITTSLTNAAPLFGVRVGEAYITASANFADVVLYHSVVVFVPMFIGWAVLLRFWAFSPFAVFFLFGCTGTVAETLAFGLQNLGNAPFWILVYGLMVWIPARTVPADRSARPPPRWLYPLAILIPILFVPLAAVLAPWLWLTPKHPSIHFPPLGGAGP